MNSVRPARPWAPIPTSAISLFIWWVVAHNSGSGWVQFLGDAAFGTVLVGIFGPALILSQAAVRLIASPTDATARSTTFVRLHTSTRLRVRPIEPPGPEAFVGPTGRMKVGDEEVTLVPPKRGVVTTVTLEIATASPFGLQWWSRKVTVPLSMPLHVSPRRGNPIPVPRLKTGDVGAASKAVRSLTGEPHSVRPYQPRDLRRRVHWPATAHAGRLMVREMEEPSEQPITLKISLPQDPDTAERIAEQALATAIAVLDRHLPLVLATNEMHGEVVAVVTDTREAGRRLARATGLSTAARIEIS